MVTGDFSGVLAALLAGERVLLLTHSRPDGDALGSVFGMRAFLNSLGKTAEVLLPEEPPSRFLPLIDRFVRNADPAAYDLIVLLDCANPPRIGAGGLTMEELNRYNFISIDHHRANSIQAVLSYTDPECSSASEIAARLALDSGHPLPVEAATCWLVGIMTDTGSFRFSNTSGGTLRVAAELLDRGAELELATNSLFFNKPLNQLKFETELVEQQLRIACNGELAWAFVPDELLEKYDFSLREDEGLIDIFRGISGVKIAMLIFHQPDGYRFSLRSKDRRFPVGPLARSFGGGGHDMASGLKLDLPTLEEAEKRIVAAITELLAGKSF